MADCTKSLLVVHRKENVQDFRDIGLRIRELDPSIAVAMISEFLDPGVLPSSFFQRPLLAVYLVNPPPKDFNHSAGKLAVEEMSKLEEYDHFKKNNIPCLPIERFRWGMELDSSIYGDWVVLKPENIQSTGEDVNMVPTKLISQLRGSDFPAGHLIHKDSYLVQRFVRAGQRPTHYRVCTFLNEILFSTKLTSIYRYPDVTSNLNVLLNITVASNKSGSRVREFVKDFEVNVLALKVSASFPTHPLLGIDILRDEVSGMLYVIETNLGGNVWSFSSTITPNIPDNSPISKKDRILQYGAWDRAAEALVRKTHELAK